jgi:protein SCO1/2
MRTASRALIPAITLTITLILGVFCPGSGANVNSSVAASVDGSLFIEDQEAGKDWVQEKNGQFIPLDVLFTDGDGKSAPLAEFIDRPTIILPIYFYCPSICSKNLANLAVALNRLNYSPGKDYRVIALSFSDTETAENARRAKQNYVKLLYDEFPEEQWKFLVGDSYAIQAVTEAMGYRFKRTEKQIFIHPSALVIVDREGRIIRYVYGSFLPGDIDMAIAGAIQGSPVLSVKRFLDFCFNSDPDANRPFINMVKIGVLLFFASIIGCLFWFFGRKKNTKRE